MPSTSPPPRYEHAMEHPFTTTHDDDDANTATPGSPENDDVWVKDASASAASPLPPPPDRRDFSVETTPALSMNEFPRTAATMAPDMKDTSDRVSDTHRTLNDGSDVKPAGSDADSKAQMRVQGGDEAEEGRVSSDANDNNNNNGAKWPPAEQIPEMNLEKGIVGWDGQDDPAYPRNFARGRKMVVLALVTVMTMTAALASSMFSPATTSLAEEFKVTNKELLAFCVSVFLFGFAFGPLLVAPLSEIYGRRVVFNVSNWFFVVFQIACAKAPSLNSLIGFRLLAGIGGSGSITLGPGAIADMFDTVERGTATSIWALGPLLGPVVGPVPGGFIGQEKGWRWVFWVLLIFGGALAALITVFYRETCAPVIMRWKTERLRKELKRDDLRSAYDLSDTATFSARRVLARGLNRPMILLFKSPIMILLSTYMAFVYGLLYLFFTTIPTVFQETYHFSVGISGLAFLGIAVGFLIAEFIIVLTSDRYVKRRMAKNNGIATPEMRLPIMTAFAFLMPPAFFGYGWTAYYKVHWIVPIIFEAPFAMAVIGIFLPVQTYVIDCYPKYAASANAALACARSVVGAVLPVAGPRMFEDLGLGWGNSTLGFLALAFAFIPIFFNRYGAFIRQKFPVNLD